MFSTLKLITTNVGPSLISGSRRVWSSWFAKSDVSEAKVVEEIACLGDIVVLDTPQSEVDEINLAWNPKQKLFEELRVFGYYPNFTYVRQGLVFPPHVGNMHRAGHQVTYRCVQEELQEEMELFLNGREIDAAINHYFDNINYLAMMGIAARFHECILFRNAQLEEAVGCFVRRSSGWMYKLETSKLDTPEERMAKILAHGASLISVPSDRSLGAMVMNRAVVGVMGALQYPVEYDYFKGIVDPLIRPSLLAYTRQVLAKKGVPLEETHRYKDMMDELKKELPAKSSLASPKISDEPVKLPHSGDYIPAFLH